MRATVAAMTLAAAVALATPACLAQKPEAAKPAAQKPHAVPPAHRGAARPPRIAPGAGGHSPAHMPVRLPVRTPRSHTATPAIGGPVSTHLNRNGSLDGATMHHRF